MADSVHSTSTPTLVSVESPYNSLNPLKLIRNRQYAIFANTHAASLGDVTWTPHICNTQVVKWGLNGYVGDTIGEAVRRVVPDSTAKYDVGREETLHRTNLIRQQKIDKVVCYTDFGISSGMRGAIVAANAAGVPVERRKLPEDLRREVFMESFASTAVPATKFALTTGSVLYAIYRFGRKALRR